MSAIARSTDMVLGMCLGHITPATPNPLPVTGTIDESGSTVKAGEVSVAKIGDTVTFSCGHTGTIVNGSTSVLVEGKPAARLGDSVVGATIASATIITGLPTVICM